MSCPSPAERARTLLRGRLPGLLFLDDVAVPLPVWHGTDHAGQPLLLVPAAGGLREALRARGPVGPGGVLRVDDVPPSADAPSLGQARASGRLHPVDPGESSTAAALEFATANPLPSLLGVGTEAVLYRLHLTGVHLVSDQGGGPLDPAEYAAAEPDPLHEAECDLLLDLADHHVDELEPWFRTALASAGIDAEHPRAARLDRYGFTVDTGRPRRRWVRLDFARPLDTVDELAQLLHPVLFHPHVS